MMLLTDTTIVEIGDTSYQISNPKSQIILLQDARTVDAKGWYENSIFPELIFPIAVAAITAYIMNRVNAKKNRAEMDKLKAETDHLKRSFQPIVFSAMNAIHEKIFDKKLEALNNLIAIRNQIISYKPIFTEEDGEPYYPKDEELYEIIFKEFSNDYYDLFKDFHSNYSYLFPDSVLNRNESLVAKMRELRDDQMMFWDAFEGNNEVSVGHEIANNMKVAIDMIEKSILDIRCECHLDTTYIKDFIEKSRDE